MVMVMNLFSNCVLLQSIMMKHFNFQVVQVLSLKEYLKDLCVQICKFYNMFLSLICYDYANWMFYFVLIFRRLRGGECFDDFRTKDMNVVKSSVPAVGICCF